MTENKEICGLVLEQFLLGELSENEREQIRKKIASDPAIAQTLKEIETSNRDFLNRFPAGRAVPEIESRSDRKYSPAAAAMASPLSSFKRRLLILTPALAAMILIFIFLHPWRQAETGGTFSDIQDDEILIKGAPLIDLNKTQLLVYRLHNQRVELLKDRQAARIGDLLQLAYVSATEAYGMIFSVDGRGGVSLHFPEDEYGSTALVRHAKMPLPQAIELDDAPGFERFYFLTSDFPIDVIQVMKLAREFYGDSQNASHEAFAPPQGINYHSIVVKKGKMP